jgi:pyridoxal phosphate enzyme (YggS family)
VISERIAEVRVRIRRAANRVGRDPDSITLLAVSKIKPAADIVAAYAAGQRDFGENYVQEFRQKSAELLELPGARFHMIGKLQSNKATPAAELFDTVHTVDSLKLARRLNSAGKPLDVFLEIKLSDEESKSGLPPDGIGELKEFIDDAPNLTLKGLMTMPPWSADPEQTRPYFRRLRELAESHGLRDLSMGMSGDLEAAVEEGSTYVRVGTAIFGKRVYPK